MQWRDRGILLAIRPFGEVDSMAHFLTKGHGLATGLVKGGVSRKQKPFLQAGNLLDLTWKARLADQLGFFTFDPIRQLGASLYGDPVRLAVLGSALAILHDCLAAGEANERIFNITEGLISVIPTQAGTGGNDDLLLSYANWERELLRELGFELCLDKCNATGTQEDLCYISPKTGHAVCRSAGELYKDMLLPLPKAWISLGDIPADAGNQGNKNTIQQALSVLEYFYRKRIYMETGKPYPFIRTTLSQYATVELKIAA